MPAEAAPLLPRQPPPPVSVPLAVVIVIGGAAVLLSYALPLAGASPAERGALWGGVPGWAVPLYAAAWLPLTLAAVRDRSAVIGWAVRADLTVCFLSGWGIAWALLCPAGIFTALCPERVVGSSRGRRCAAVAACAD
eukprot:gene16138-3743_t